MKWPSASGGRQARPWRVDVRHTRTCGRLASAAAARAAANAVTSWPSRSVASQPNVRHFALIGSTVVMLSTGPSTWELLASTRTVRRDRREGPAHTPPPPTFPPPRPPPPPYAQHPATPPP